MNAYSRVCHIDLRSRWFEVAKRIGALSNIGNLETKTLNGKIPFQVIFNKFRKTKPNQVLAEGIAKTSLISPEEQKKKCNLCKEIKRFEEYGDNMLTDKYSPYLICPNLYPIELGHTVIIRKDHGDPNKLEKDDLEIALQIVKETDYRLWHNMVEAALSQLHPHFQGVFHFYPIEYAKKKPLSRCDDIYELEGYPAAHIVFGGENAPEMASMFVRKLKRYTVAITKEGIHIFPIKVPQFSGGIGGFESSGVFVLNSKAEYDSITADMIEKRIAGAMYSKEEMDMLKIWVEASSLAQTY